MILRPTTVHENPGSAGILPAVAGHRAQDDVAGRMPALPFSWKAGEREFIPQVCKLILPEGLPDRCNTGLPGVPFVAS
jgi:hypothetical protein